MTHSMFMAIISFILFLGIAGGAGYLFWKHSALKADLKDSFGSSPDIGSGGGGGRAGPGQRKAD